MKYLITGHTGFKGAWLSLMLEMQGHTVSGISLEPAEKSLFKQAGLAAIYQDDLRIDVRNSSELKKACEKINPDVIIHLAAQSLVRNSYKFPVETFEVNVLGTLNVLEATKELIDLKAVLIVTTDKVYKNHNQLRGYLESDELGGDDPYSASKAAADIGAQSWIKNYAKVPMAIARAGNVIGGGDWAQDRIIPDLVSAYSVGSVPKIRYPGAVRPWQHVLDCLNGYMALVDKQINKNFTGEWNFGPELETTHSVQDLVEIFSDRWGVTGEKWNQESNTQPSESEYLLLDSMKSRSQLNWTDKLDFISSVNWTADWFKSLDQSSARHLCEMQVKNFMDL